MCDYSNYQFDIRSTILLHLYLLGCEIVLTFRLNILILLQNHIMVKTIPRSKCNSISTQRHFSLILHIYINEQNHYGKLYIKWFELRKIGTI